MDKEQILVRWLNSLGSDDQLQGLSFNERAELWENIQDNKNIDASIKKSNIVLLTTDLIRVLKNREAELWFVAVNSEGESMDFPYQEHKSNAPVLDENEKISITIRLFGDLQSAQQCADEINDTVRRKNAAISTEQIVAAPYAMGWNAKRVAPIEEIERMGVQQVILADTSIQLDLRNILAIRKKSKESYFGTIAAETYAAIGIYRQLLAEKRDEAQLESAYADILVSCAVHSSIGVIVSDSVLEAGNARPLMKTVQFDNGDSEKCVALYTDWEQVCEELGNSFNTFRLFSCSLEQIADYGLGVVFGNNLYFSQKQVQSVLPYTERGRMAYDYVLWCYQKEDASITEIECEQVLRDIIAAPEIRKEFYSCMKREEKVEAETGEKLNRIAFSFAEKGTEVLPGISAKALVDSGLCTTPAAAYRVMAILANDNDGSAQKAFKNAELYR